MGRVGSWCSVCFTVVIGVSSAHPAAAAPFSATEISYDKALLSQFNLINLGNLTANASTDGRVLVGGSVTGGSAAVACASSNCAGNTTIGSTSSATVGVVLAGSSSPAYGALTVFGSITGGFGVQRGDIDVAGNITSGTYALNGKGTLNVVGNGLTAGSLSTTVTSPVGIRDSSVFFLGNVSSNTGGITTASAASVFPFGSNATEDFATPLKNLAQGLAALPGTPNVSAQSLPSNSNSPFLAATSIVATNSDNSITKRYGVVTTTLANLATQGANFSIGNGTNDATFVLVTGDGAYQVLPSLKADSNVIYDFVDATTLRFASGSNASILAPLANITQQGGVINGTVIVQSINQSAALQQGNAFTGDLSGLSLTFARVPEPASLLLAGLGVFATVVLRRRRPEHAKPRPVSPEDEPAATPAAPPAKDP